ncbi:MAG: ABC transporter ATP-binding protein [Chloroflexi bacterium]|nr:ABC transporter ATP-binding protein [Chloroflexota bacterium]MBL7061800.1 ABC transporter ATP-binding protein [Dehalococcoidia bacterium]
MREQGVIETEELVKTYGKFIAVDKLNLRVDEGEVFGFLGPNGAGKTTTILMLLGLTEPTSGKARICGFDPTREPLKVKRITGYLPEKVGFYEDLTARENLDYTAALNGLSREVASRKIDELVDMVGLSEMAGHKVGTFSHGMKQRLGIADVMIKDPKVAFFDEPTAGIDPEGIEQVLTLITNMAKQKVTVVLSSHQLQQVQKICTRVGILSKGHLVAEGSVDQLGREAIGGGKFRVEVQVSEPTSKLVKSIKSIKGVINVESSGDLLLISCGKDLRPQIARAVVDSECLLVQMKIEEYGLDDVYMKYFRES